MVSEVVKSTALPLAIVAVALLEWQAMAAGMDGALFMSSIGIIGGIAGYKVKTDLEKRKSKCPPVE